MKRRTAWTTGTAAAAIVLGVAAALLLFPRAESDAEANALAYLQALGKGDLAAVEAAGVEVSAEAAAAFTAASGHISDVTISSSANSESETTVRAGYVLAGEQHETEFTMTEAAGRWVPDAGSAFGAIEIEAPAQIGDAVLPAGAVTTLLPAEYDLVASPSDFLQGSTTIRVGPGDVQKVAVETTLTADAAALAQEQLDEYLVACTQPSTDVVASCGIAIPWAADFSALSSISYRVERTPTLSLTPTSFRASEGVLVATVVGTGIGDDSVKSLSYRTEDWALRGDVAFSTDDIVLSVW